MLKDYEVAYICDRKACGEQCPSLKSKGDPCNHTTNINHAVNFIKITDNKFAEINDHVQDFIDGANQ